MGKVLVRKIGKREIRARIIETEAYVGEQDRACHARFGKTKRNSVMYDRAGHAYVYLCYGIHELLNIVTEEKGFPAAVLIRAVVEDASCIRQVPELGALHKRFALCGASKPSSSILPQRRRLGPGNLTKYLKITRELNGEDLTQSKRLWVESDGLILKKSRIKSADRIGIAYAGKWAKKKWRFFVE